MDIKKKNLHITKLLLDAENPRHDIIKNQGEIIKHLVENEKIENLAKDIAERRALSPLDTIGVLKTNNGEYVVIEGNRRVCACMLLNNPSLCPDQNTESKMKQFKKNGSIPTTLECAIFTDREKADHWIKLRHEGEQNGIGTKEWDTEQQARYSAKMGRKNPNMQVIKLSDYAVKENIISKTEFDKLPITTMKRYLGNPVVRNTFGLQNGRDLKSRHESEIFKALVKQFLEDVQKKIVNSRTKKPDWEAYANNLQNTVSGPPSPDNSVIDYEYDEPEPVDPESSDVSENDSVDEKHEDKEEDPQTKTEKKIRAKNDPGTRKYLPGTTVFKIDDKVLNRVYRELKTV